MNEKQNILTLSGYWARYQEIYTDFGTDRQAWEALENEMIDRFGIGRYSSYESFRMNKSRFYRKRRKARDILR